MESISLLFLGLLLGMRHSLEADHLAAVASLATRSRSFRSTVVQGVAWGFGHTLTLLVVGGACLLLRASIPERVAQGLEAAVGVMLLVLGADVLLRWRRRRIHVHLHRHGDGTVHLHAHSHLPAAEEGAAMRGEDPAAHRPHAAHPHEHPHAHGLPLRAMLVGLVHGLAGSAALLLLTLSTLSSVGLGLIYIAVFGVGSILGMAVLSAILAFPMSRKERGIAGWHNGLEVVIGVSTLLIGGWVLYQAPWFHGLFGSPG
jgi:ABC-type nickel/cobalt efflux system permease component RcnA